MFVTRKVYSGTKLVLSSKRHLAVCVRTKNVRKSVLRDLFVTYAHIAACKQNFDIIVIHRHRR